MGISQLFFWRHKHSKAVIKHDDYEKLPKLHKEKFYKSQTEDDSTHHVMNKGNDWDLYETLGVGDAINLGIVVNAALTSDCNQQSQPQVSKQDSILQTEFGLGSGGGAGAGGDFSTSQPEVNVPVDTYQTDQQSVPDSVQDTTSFDSSSSNV